MTSARRRLPAVPRTAWRRSGVLVAVLLLAAVGGTALLAPHQPDGPTRSTPAPAPAGVEPSSSLAWADEFDGPAGSPADPERWSHDVGGSGWGNEQLEYDTEGTQNVALDGRGNLAITAHRDGASGHDCWYGPCRYTSGRITTADKATAQYGRVEARMRIPAGGGLWPAFWMLGADFASKGWPDAGEIDVMENVGHEPGTVHGSLHGPGYSGADSLTGSYRLPGDARLSDDFHTYAVDWAPGAVTFSLDGVPYSTQTSRDSDAWAHDEGPAFLILNLAVGGTWPGEPDPETTFPAQLLVDRVAVYHAQEPRPLHSAADGIAAEDAHSHQGAVMRDAVGAEGTVAGGLAAGDWLAYADLDLGQGGAALVSLRLASGAETEGGVEVRVNSLGGPPIGVVPVAPTGSWTTWTTATTRLRLPPGAHTVYLTMASDSSAEFVDLDGFTISAGRD